VDDSAPAGAPGPAPPGAGLRIGELSRRVGVSPDVLRAWERRYGLLRPRRSRSGQRLYTRGDEDRVREMLGHMERGYSAAIAARLAAAAPSAPPGRAGSEASALGPAVTPAAPADGPWPVEPRPVTTADLDALAADLRTALHGLDEARTEAVLDRLLAGFALDTVLRHVVLPFLRDLGESWARGTISVGQEHFATAVIAGRLHALARGWDAGVGPRAVVACPSEERHDLGLLCFALAMRDRGWRVWYLGADTPVSAIDGVATQVDADLAVVAAVRAEPFVGVLDELAAVGARRRLSIGGRGASPALASRVGAELLPDDPIAAADLVSAARSA
jgi:MerR family transcriptional regulator, light-induced transcriptional regulator